MKLDKEAHIKMLWERIDISARERNVAGLLFYVSRLVDNLLDFDHGVLPIIDISVETPEG